MPPQLVDFATVLLADAPNVADWIAAVGQALGALFTAATAGVAVWLGWRDRKWRREDQRDRDAMQARLLTVALDHEYDPWRENVFYIDVHNASDEPFYEVKITEIVSEGNRGDRWDFDWDPRGDEGLIRLTVLHSGKDHSWPVSYKDEDRRSVPARAHQTVTITYVDSKGLRWSRTDQHAPQRVVE